MAPRDNLGSFHIPQHLWNRTLDAQREFAVAAEAAAEKQRETEQKYNEIKNTKFNTPDGGVKSPTAGWTAAGTVAGSKGVKHTIQYRRNGFGEVAVRCSCLGFKTSKKVPKTCKHIANVDVNAFP